MKLRSIAPALRFARRGSVTARRARHAFEKARADLIVHRRRAARKALATAWSFLATFADGAQIDDDLRKTLTVLTPAGIEGKVKKAYKHAPRPKSPLFDEIEAFLAVDRAVSSIFAAARANLLHDVHEAALARMVAIKRERGLVGFDDLVERVHAALASPQGARLASELRRNCPVALVDEFQDTDAMQWDVFRASIARDDVAKPALFLIGDPKQAIYRFRGGDMYAYHAAGADAESTETLDRNFRSRPRMIEAVAAVFAEGGAHPFADGMTRYPVVRPGDNVADADLADGKRVAACAASSQSFAWRRRARPAADEDGCRTRAGGARGGERD